MVDRAQRRIRAFVAAAMACAIALAGVFIAGNHTDDAQLEALVLPVPASAESYVPGELVVGLLPDAQGFERARDAVEQLGFSVPSILLGASDADARVILVETGEGEANGSNLAAAARLVAAIPAVSFVQPNYRYASMAAAADVVDDPAAAYQSYLDAWNDSRGTNVADAWPQVEGSNRVSVAVLDTGMYSMADYSEGEPVTNDPQNFHQEFSADNLDMEAGRDFVHSGDELLPLVNSANPTGDDNGHGTHVAGIIAAGSSIAGDAPIGMAGVAPNARIIPCKVLDSSGEGDTASFIRAYDYLVNDVSADANLRVINLSASLAFDAADAEGEEAADEEPELDPDPDDNGSTEPDGEFEFVDEDGDFQDEALRAAIVEAQGKGIVTVSAAGNEGSDALAYPGNYPECICVAALDADGQVAEFSNMNEHVDVAAPGVGIYSSWANQADAYMTLDGTSQATAIVSGVLAMMFGANSELSVEGAKGALYTGGVVAGTAVSGGCHGAVDAAAAVKAATNSNATWNSTDDEEKWNAAVAATEADSGLTSLAGAKVKVAKASYKYTGKKIKPAVTVTLDGKTLKKNTDYTVSYLSNKKPGKAKIVVKGAGDYTGSATGGFKIKLGKTKVTKLIKGERSFTVKWKKQKSGKVGYQIRYSKSKSMKNAKKKTVKKNATTKLKVNSLTPGTRYYVQVRTYKTIGGKKYYSAWSAKKSVKLMNVNPEEEVAA